MGNIQDYYIINDIQFSKAEDGKRSHSSKSCPHVKGFVAASRTTEIPQPENHLEHISQVKMTSDARKLPWKFMQNSSGYRHQVFKSY
jgi:hypothetical protein